MYRVALYSAMSWARGERKHRRPEGGSGQRELSGLLAESPGVRNDRLDWLYDQIGKLDEIDRSLTLLLLDGFSYREMAATLGITESNVGVKISRIKAQLTKQSKEETTHGLQ